MKRRISTRNLNESPKPPVLDDDEEVRQAQMLAGLDLNDLPEGWDEEDTMGWRPSLDRYYR